MPSIKCPAKLDAYKKSFLKQTFHELRNALQGSLLKYVQEVLANWSTEKQQRVRIDATKKHIAFIVYKPVRFGFI
jgi:hypothetical protein